MNNSKLISLIIMHVFLFSCSIEKMELEPRGYLEFLSKNRTVATTNLNQSNCAYSIEHVPIEKYVAQNLSKNGAIQDLKLVAKDFEGFRYFNFKLNYKGPQQLDEFINDSFNDVKCIDPNTYLHFKMKDAFKLKQGEHELECAYYHLDKSQMGYNQLNFNLIFFDPTNEINTIVDEDFVFQFQEKNLCPQVRSNRLSKESINRKPILIL